MTEANRSRANHPLPASQQPTISAPNGIAIGGGIVNNPTVNNYGPPPPPSPVLTWIVEPDAPTMQGLGIVEGTFRHRIKISVNTPVETAFAIKCSSPVKSLMGHLQRSFMQTDIRTWAQGNIAFIRVGSPDTKPGNSYTVTLGADEDFHVVDVRFLAPENDL